MVISNSRNAGLFAEITTVIRHLKKIKDENKKIKIDWNGSNSLYYEKEYGENVWEYYFEQIDDNVENEKIDYVLSDYIPISNIENLNIRETFNYYFKNFIRLNEKTNKIIEEEIKKVNKKTLGIHIRKTDKFLGQMFNEPMAIPIDDSKVFELIDNKIIYYDNIFLATDCEYTYNSFKEKYKDILIENKRIRGNGIKAIHTDNKNNGYKKGLEALIDSYILSNCGFLIRSTSNLSSFSMFLNLDLDCININEIFRNDKREYEFNLISKL